MQVITFLLEAKQPILATSFQGDPNSDVSYPYIPGSMIRGALISRYIKRHPELPNDFLSEEINQDSNQEIKRLFFDGSTRYLNAYLFCEEQKKRTLPVPLAWYKDKDDKLPSKLGESLEIYDLSQHLSDKSSLKMLGNQFCTINERQAVLYQEKKRINIHNLRDRTKGCSSPIRRNPKNNQVIHEGEGAIFRYEALDSEQTFQGVILCKDNDVDTVKILLSPENIWLGGSQSAGYGHTKIILCEPNKNQKWSEIDIGIERRVNHQKLITTLLSDTIVRNNDGQVSADPLSVIQAIEDKLEEKLNVKIKLPQPTNIFVSSKIVGGFNRKWGLPLPQVTALSAGSVFVFDTKLTTEQIETLENEGIGERCIDGFGRIAVNWLGNYDKFNIIFSETDCDLDIALEEENYDLAVQIAENILRQRLEHCLVKQVGNIKLTEPITNNQLSRLEMAAIQGLNTMTYVPIIELLSNLTSKAHEQYRNTKVSRNKSLEEKIKDWLEKPIGDSESWLINPQELKVDFAGVILEIQPNSDLAREYTLRFIMAVAKKAKKEKI